MKGTMCTCTTALGPDYRGAVGRHQPNTRLSVIWKTSKRSAREIDAVEMILVGHEFRRGTGSALHGPAS